MLLGAHIYFELLTDGLLKLGYNLPILHNTHLGYVVTGKIPYMPPRFKNMQTQSHFCATDISHPDSQNISLLTHLYETDEFIKKFWEIEECPTTSSNSNKFLTELELRAEDIFKNTTQRLPSGRFQVDLPLISHNEHHKLGDSFFQAKRRFLNLEKRLQKYENLYSQYKEFISDYVSLDHARYVPLSLLNDLSENKYFLAHHCVLKEESLTTKLRVVFDGSMKTSTGTSLNDIMLKGYTVQPDLFSILLRFRTFIFVLITDIQKMFRQIEVNPSQRFLLNILWRDSPQEELKCLELRTVTYGTNCATFLSTRCLKELAQQSKDTFPLASDALLNSCYVDDILYGCNDLNTLFEAYKQISECLNSACISLHKWSSNSQEFVSSLSQASQESNYVLNPENKSNKILGLCWNSSSDNFSIIIPNITIKDSYTKREILSTIASIYDPIGLINPVVVTAKIIMQRIWLAKLNWDATVDSDILSDWKLFLANLSSLSDLYISRSLYKHQDIQKFEIHGFSDASIKAYGACVYLRVIYKDNSVTSTLISSKSRVAPLKVISLPKLELLGAALLSNLVTKIISVLQTTEISCEMNSVHLWSDSEIVLAWLKSHPSRWSTFVANRVAIIQEETSNYTWRHIKSKQNPADILSRGSLPSDLLNNPIWWQGPQFLMDPKLNLDNFKHHPEVNNPPEQRKTAHVTQTSIDEMYALFLKFSNYTRLQRTIAYCLRFANNVRKKSEILSGPLSAAELQKAEEQIVRIIQFKFFKQEVECLKSQRNLSNKQLQKLNPFLDSAGLLRVGGRLINANIPFQQKFPLLLPSKNHVVRLLLKREHLRFLHAGPQNTLCNVRLRFWPLDGLREIKRIIYECKVCYRFKAQVASQLMADLPKERVQISRPFTNVGIDFGGPFPLKSSHLKKAPITKCYIAIFVCMVTRAVHIELVSSLSTESFLLTLKRFIARRGNPNLIYSDNATNFVGAKNYLKELYSFIMNKETSQSIKDFCAVNNITWKFIPPRSPHHGGLWEAAIKSVKFHLIRIMGNTNFTFEELSTVLAQIEAVLNSRPICELSNDPLDYTYLTPGHFLIGSSMTSYVEKDVSNTPQNRLTLWQKCSQITQQLWKRWTKDYLNRLQHRPKWFAPSRNIEINDLVLLKDELTPPLKWPMARVVELFPGKDDRVRVVKVKTKDGIFTRSIAKISPLPGSQVSDSCSE